MDGLVRIKVNELPDGRIIIYNTMPDISMCSDIYCELRKTCYRYNAKPGMYQSYFMNSPRDNDTCNYYWKMNV